MGSTMNLRYDKDYINNIIKDGYELGLKETPKGTVASYIPELAKAKKEAFGICMKDRMGHEICYGDVTTRFSIQSISKIIILAAALKFKGFDKTFLDVSMEPTGDAFNSIIKLDTRSDKPFNPMINAGAIQIVSSLVNDVPFEEMVQFARVICMDPEISLNEAVYMSEDQTGDRNRSIAYLLKSKGVLEADPLKTVDVYFKMCSLNVNAKSLAGLGLTISENGMNPFTHEQFINPNDIRTIKSIMFTCGLYDFSGEWGVKVGIPAKSGVGGGIACAAKNGMGFGLYGPSLDQCGNSVAAIKAMEYISKELGLHVFDYEKE